MFELSPSPPFRLSLPASPDIPSLFAPGVTVSLPSPPLICNQCRRRCLKVAIGFCCCLMSFPAPLFTVSIPAPALIIVVLFPLLPFSVFASVLTVILALPEPNKFTFSTPCPATKVAQFTSFKTLDQIVGSLRCREKGQSRLF
ncbi:MAG: hypothetical protein IPN42_19225 [Methylococcaceae bacterium]|nr:hypothetical protein [Methylococcaceae bacterium]